MWLSWDIWGLARTADSVDIGDDANRMVKMILQARRHEKNYIIRKDPAYIATVDDSVENIIKQAGKTREKFESIEKQGRIDTIIIAARNYRTAFHNYLDLDKQKNESLTIMREKAKDALDRLNQIRADQQNRLNIPARTREGSWEDELIRLEKANLLLQRLLEAGKTEKELIISNGENKWREQHQILLDQSFRLANDLKNQNKAGALQADPDPVTAALLGYQAAFTRFVSALDEQKKADANMVTAARESQKICEEIRSEQKAVMEGQISLAKTLSLSFTAAGIALGLLLAWLITRGITPADQPGH